MSLVNRAPLTNYRGRTPKGIVRYISKKGAPLNWTPERRPVGTTEARPDIRRSYKEVLGGDRQKFSEGRGLQRRSVYNTNTSGDSGSKWDGTRSRA